MQVGMDASVRQACLRMDLCGIGLGVQGNFIAHQLNCRGR